MTVVITLLQLQLVSYSYSQRVTVTTSFLQLQLVCYDQFGTITIGLVQLPVYYSIIIILFSWPRPSDGPWVLTSGKSS